MHQRADTNTRMQMQLWAQILELVPRAAHPQVLALADSLAAIENEAILAAQRQGFHAGCELKRDDYRQGLVDGVTMAYQVNKLPVPKNLLSCEEYELLGAPSPSASSH